jgi:hypothetical protein
MYIREREVKLGRLQIFNNRSPYPAADPETVWTGREYFRTEGGDLRSMPDVDSADLSSPVFMRYGSMISKSRGE